MITFKVYEQRRRDDEDTYVEIDPATTPTRVRMDYERRNGNVESGVVLCERCNGTGNELYMMWRKCPKCRGTGIEFADSIEVEGNIKYE